MPAPNTTLSHDPATEEALLGCCLLSESVASAAATRLRADDFGDEDHRGLFQLISEASREGAPTDGVSIRNRLNGHALHFQRDPGHLIAGIVATVPRISSGLSYIEALVDLRERRELERAGDWLKREATGSHPHAAKVAAQLLLSSNEMGDEQESSQPWPIMRPEAYDGLAGEVIAALAPHTEADPAGLLMTFLVQFGAMCGGDPHLMLSGAAHPPRLFAVLVGTSGSRKGGAESMIRWLMGLSSPITVADRWVKGLSSGEGLLDLVQDPVISTQGNVVEPGAEDKRLYICETEFTALLDHFQRKGNTLSPMIRDAWDSGNLRKLTTTNPKRATGAHICIMGHSTPEELTSRLTRSEVTNGFANRFLYVMVKRANLLPFGGDITESELLPLAHQITDAVVAARLIRGMRFAPDTLANWGPLYEQMVTQIPPAPLGNFLERNTTQVLRLGMVYALMEGSPEIEWRHMQSALAAWSYAEESVRYMLGTAHTPASGTDDDVTLLLELVVKRPGIGSREAGRVLSWSGTKLAVTRARAERHRVLEVQTRPTTGRPRGGMYPR